MYFILTIIVIFFPFPEQRIQLDEHYPSESACNDAKEYVIDKMINELPDNARVAGVCEQAATEI